MEGWWAHGQTGSWPSRWLGRYGARWADSCGGEWVAGEAGGWPGGLHNGWTDTWVAWWTDGWLKGLEPWTDGRMAERHVGRRPGYLTDGVMSCFQLKKPQKIRAMGIGSEDTA